MQYATVNPATGKIIEEYETMPRREVLGIAARSQAVFRQWRAVPIAERAFCFTELGRVLRRRTEKHARLMTTEMGKIIGESRAEVQKCAWLCDVYAEHAESWLREEPVEADGQRHFVTFEPLGVILSIMPWNFPFWQALRFAVPAMIAGNTTVLKHASNVTGCALAIEEAFGEAGFPPGAFRTVLADHRTVADLIACDEVAGVSLTGSTAAGARIGEEAGRCLKKVVLELGGADPFIVLEDADIEFAARNAVTGRMVANGQSCIAAKRFIVASEIAEAFSRRFAELVSQLSVGDPLDEKTRLGPVVSAEARDELESQLHDALGRGARLLTGGQRLPGPGFFLQPTVLTDTTPDMRVVREEVFGPVAPVIVVAGEDEAIAVSNDSPFGLGGSVWTRDLERGVRLARRVESGTLFVNSFVKSDPRMPFGGIKKSGIGRELSWYGLREFVNVKGISVYGHG